MGSSAKTGKKFFEGHRSTFWIKMPFGIGHPPPTHQLQSTCMGEGSRVPNLQTEFNYLDSFKSYGIFSDFVVPTWSPLSLRRHHHSHIVPTSSPLSPSSLLSQCGLHGLWSPHVVPVIPTSSPSSLHRPRHPHVIPIVPVIPRRSPCGLHGLWSLHVVSIVPMSSPHHLEGPHIIPNPPDTHSTHHPPPGGGGPKSVKMQ